MNTFFVTAIVNIYTAQSDVAYDGDVWNFLKKTLSESSRSGLVGRGGCSPSVWQGRQMRFLAGRAMLRWLSRLRKLHHTCDVSSRNIFFKKLSTLQGYINYLSQCNQGNSRVKELHSGFLLGGSID